MTYVLLITGVVAIGWSDKLTSAILSQIDPNPDHHCAVFDRVAGTGVVPRWISTVHLAGVASVILGLIRLFVR